HPPGSLGNLPRSDVPSSTSGVLDHHRPRGSFRQPCASSVQKFPLFLVVLNIDLSGAVQLHCRLRIVASFARNSASSRRRFSSLARFSLMRARQARPSKAQGVYGYFLSSSSKYCKALGGS